MIYRTLALIILASMTAYNLYITATVTSRSQQPFNPYSPVPLKYPIGVPDKFSPSGEVQPYPGNTIISHLPSSSPLHTSLELLYRKLESSPLSHLYALLPPSSWHMTIFEGVVDRVRSPGRWPADLPSDASLSSCTALFASKLDPASFDLGTAFSPPYKLNVTSFEPLVAGITVHIEPVSAAENRRMRGLRDRLSDTLKIRAKIHDSYGFHLSVGYLLRILSEEQKEELNELLMQHFQDMPKEFELGAPEFCTFEDMFKFTLVLYLEKNSKDEERV